VVWGHTDVLGRGASARKLKELHQPGWCWRRGEAGRDNKGHALPTIRPRDPQTYLHAQHVVAAVLMPPHAESHKGGLNTALLDVTSRPRPLNPIRHGGRPG
jgi:hypothetical protein